MTALNKHTELRKELSNPAIGSNHHLRKLALSLLDELEAAEKRIAEHNFENRLLANADRDINALRQRIAELEAREVTLPQRLQPGADGYDDWYVHSEDAGEYLKADDVIEAIRAAGIKVKE
ncbi:hypothetical protein KNC47_004204 [Salmonella enterica]|nr:hypothetical protein [Salmonella enterica]